MEQFLYKPFGKYVMRTPMFPFSCIMDFSYNETYFNNAILAASPELYKEKQKARGLYSDKMFKTLYRYWSRACSRPTPFGLFAGCSAGEVGNATVNTLVPIHCSLLRTRLDMDYICSLIQWIEDKKEIKKALLFYPNDSIYKIGDRLRYVDYYYKNTLRVHQLQEVDASHYLEKILTYSATGHTIGDIAQIITGEDITYDEAVAFVEELIKSQILKSELQARLTGDDMLKTIIRILETRIGQSEIIDRLKHIIIMLENINRYDKYTDKALSEIIDELSYFPVKYNVKYLFQTDCFKPTSEATVSDNIIKDIQEAINFLCRLNNSKMSENRNMNDFANQFQERYANEEIPLLVALDKENGIGYPINISSHGLNPLLDGIVVPRKSVNVQGGLEYTEKLILNKYYKLLRVKGSGVSEIELTDDDLKTNKSDSTDYIQTAAVMCSIIKDSSENGRLTYIKSVGGASAASLLGRFSYLDDSINSISESICNKEQDLLVEDAVLAEIVHLPESRIGNISSRPLLRELEIHYLAASGLPMEKSIPASDIMIGIKNGKLQIRSKSLNKIIKPRLTNAHNYLLNGTPVYRFLCDFQTYGNQVAGNINIDHILELLHYVPRVKYKNVLLSLQTWLIAAEDIAGTHYSDRDIIPIIRNWRNSESLPERVVIKENDNELYIDFNNDLSVVVFWDMLKKKRKLIVVEFIFGETDAVISDGISKYCGEFVIPFYKNESYGKS